MIRTTLRTFAVAIAVAAVIDPAIRREVDVQEHVTVVASTARVAAEAGRLRDALPASSLSVYDATSAASACPTTGACVMVSDGVLPDRVTSGARLVGVLNVSRPTLITRVEAPDRVHRAGTATLRVHTAQPVSRFDVFDGESIVGTAAPQSSPAEVAWVPVRTGARALRVFADGEAAQTAVIVDADPAAVVFYEPQATWLGTFVRRLLEDDPRFALQGRTRIAPPVSIARGKDTALNAATLEEARTVVVTAPEMLGATDVDLLERFVTRRGGSLVVLTDRAPTGAVLRLLPRLAGERRDPQPRTIGLLRATEWLAFAGGLGITPLAVVDDQAVVASRSVGRGRVIVSGALDAWRYRETSPGFATFWPSLIWNAAVLAGAPLRVETDRSVARPGEPVYIEAELQTDSGDDVSTHGALVCGADKQFVRLWPAARRGSVFGTVRGSSAAECLLIVTINGMEGRSPVTFRDDWLEASSEDGRLEALAAAHGAELLNVGDEDELVRQVQDRLMTRRIEAAGHPMRSPWWLLPFVLCLGGEWWLRRRSGLS
jgi:hypothetical protein